MKEYKGDKIRNVAVVSHGGAGKTSLVEAFLFNANAVTRLGKVDDGTATTDFEPEEIKRKVTISSALAPVEWKEHKVNFIDTPGKSDFVAEVHSALRAADSVLVTLCAAAGVEPGPQTHLRRRYRSQHGRHGRLFSGSCRDARNPRQGHA